MLQNRDDIEKFIWWEPKGGTSAVWYDNWTQLGPLYTYQIEVQTCHSLMDIEFFMKEVGWDYDSMYDHLPYHVVEHIRQHMDHIRQTDMGDKPWWIKTSTGKFSVKSAWEILRKKEEVNENCKMIWVQDLPFKISFFSWRVWTNRVPEAAVIAH